MEDEHSSENENVDEDEKCLDSGNQQKQAKEDKKHKKKHKEKFHKKKSHKKHKHKKCSPDIDLQQQNQRCVPEPTKNTDSETVPSGNTMVLAEGLDNFLLGTSNSNRELTFESDLLPNQVDDEEYGEMSGGIFIGPINAQKVGNEGNFINISQSFASMSSILPPTLDSEPQSFIAQRDEELNTPVFEDITPESSGGNVVSSSESRESPEHSESDSDSTDSDSEDESTTSSDDSSGSSSSFKPKHAHMFKPIKVSDGDNPGTSGLTRVPDSEPPLLLPQSYAHKPTSSFLNDSPGPSGLAYTIQKDNPPTLKRKNTNVKKSPNKVKVNNNSWKWVGKEFKKPGAKGKEKKVFYKTIQRGQETISVGECAVLLSTGRYYVAQVESMWESVKGKQLKVKWFYHPEETEVRPLRKLQLPNGVFKSNHTDDNDIQTISHKCEVVPLEEYRNRLSLEPDRLASFEDYNDLYYMAGFYNEVARKIFYEPDV
uniref:BAH domain-containing protein n=2 Tax=Clastoptera arizonana TaxID=38151 RepID=A0A1B6E3E0_9HEMI